MSKQISFKITDENLEKILNSLKDLSGIDNNAMIKIDAKDTLIYSLIGVGNSVNAFKSFNFKTDDIFDIGEINEPIIFITKDLKNMHKNLKILWEQGNVHGKIYYDDLGGKFYSDRIEFNATGKLKLNFYGGDPSVMNTNISLDQIREKGSPEYSNFNFRLNSDDFANIKKLSLADVVSDVFFMSTILDNGKYHVSISESSWDLVLSEIEFDDEITLSFPKKFFKKITISGDDVLVYVFDTHLMVSTGNTDYLISTEITV